LPNEIVIKAMKTFNFTTRGAVIYQTLFQLITTRNIIPRYSIVNLNLMKELALKLSVPLTGTVSDSPYPFEFYTPKELIHYEKELLENMKALFLKKINKPEKRNFPKHQFIHLSSNYNKSEGIEKQGAAITGNKGIDKIFYVNAPRYENIKENTYDRENYTHPQ
jgi:hypothetical protein